MDYSKYERSKKEWVKLFMVWFSICILFSYLFYKNIIGILFLLPFFYFYQNFDRKKQVKKRRDKLSEQFTEMLQVMIAALKSGSSLEKAIFISKKRLAELYGEEELIMSELALIERGLLMNMNIENLFMDLGKRSGVEEIREFSEVLSICKRTGGNLIKVMENTGVFLIEKKEMEGEIKALVSGKRMEGRAMGFILPGILFYINLSMPDVSRNLYQDMAGRVIMTGILLVYLVCLLWFDKLSDIKV